MCMRRCAQGERWSDYYVGRLAAPHFVIGVLWAADEQHTRPEAPAFFALQATHRTQRAQSLRARMPHAPLTI